MRVPRQQVIVVTDGDVTAYRGIRAACEELGLTVVKATRGNPTPIRGQRLIDAIMAAGDDAGRPVVAMVDDRGEPGTGAGERDLTTILASDQLQVRGVVAVAANTRGVAGVVPDRSVDKRQRIVRRAVNKGGQAQGTVLRGDTVDVLRKFPEVPVVGLGDPGKMGGSDDASHGSPVTARALRALLNTNGAAASGGEASPRDWSEEGHSHA